MHDDDYTRWWEYPVYFVLFVFWIFIGDEGRF